MGESHVSIYWAQLKAMLKRNILLKKREKRKTTAVMGCFGVKGGWVGSSGGVCLLWWMTT